LQTAVAAGDATHTLPDSRRYGIAPQPGRNHVINVPEFRARIIVVAFTHQRCSAIWSTFDFCYSE
jgi:hypothetical protein